jgi:hypothetical protein
MSKKTIKNLIAEKYIEFKKTINDKFNNEYNDLFPNIDDIDIVDLLYFFNLRFASTNDDENKQAVKDIASIYKIDISDDKFEELFIYVNDFIQFLKKLQQ